MPLLARQQLLRLLLPRKLSAKYRCTLTSAALDLCTLSKHTNPRTGLCVLMHRGGIGQGGEEEEEEEGRSTALREAINSRSNRFSIGQAPVEMQRMRFRRLCSAVLAHGRTTGSQQPCQ